MSPKHWANIPNGDAAKHEGRNVALKISASETKPDSAKGMDVFVFADPDGGNVDGTFVARDHRAEGCDTKPPFRKALKLAGTSTELKFQISVAGGDKFGFKVSKKDDASGAKSMPGEKFIVWRKVYVQTGHMTGCAHVDPTSLNGKFASMFIELEKDGSLRELAHQANITDLAETIDKLNRAVGATKMPPITVKLVFVDRIMDAAELAWDVDITPGQVSKARLARIIVKNDELTWPFDDWLVSGKIYLFDSGGTRMAEDAIQNYVTRLKMAPGQSKTRPFARYHEHKEGLATNRLLLNLSRFPNIERWMKERSGICKVMLRIRYVEGVAGGMARSTAPWIVMATRNGWDYQKETHMPTILLHEFGHVFGHVTRYVPRYIEDTGAYDDRDEYSHWYEKHGGVGPHCHNGSTIDHVNNTCRAGAGACVMYHASPGQGPDFCGDCQEILKRAPLLNLGRANVWGGVSWDPNYTP